MCISNLLFYRFSNLQLHLRDDMFNMGHVMCDGGERITGVPTAITGGNPLTMEEEEEEGSPVT